MFFNWYEVNLGYLEELNEAFHAKSLEEFLACSKDFNRSASLLRKYGAFEILQLGKPCWKSEKSTQVGHPSLSEGCFVGAASRLCAADAAASTAPGIGHPAGLTGSPGPRTFP